jgi:nucleoside-diphosphate-sugar epimerase
MLVTGASGFVGGRVVERIAIKGTDGVRALVRNWSRSARVAKFPIEIATGDIMQPQQVAAAVKGVTHVVHCAYTDDRDSIVQGTRNLLAAALETGVERFVYLSTAEVYGPNANGIVDESTPVRHSGRVYGDAKIDAEEVCRQFHERGLPITILRPSIVYGPFGNSWTIDIAKRLQSGRWCEFDDYGEGFCNAVYVDDLVSAIILSANFRSTEVATFNINGPDIGTWNEYFRRFNAVLKLPPLATKSAGQSALRSAVFDRLDRVACAIVSRFEDRLMEIYLRGGPASRVMKRVKTLLNSAPSPSELEDLYSRRAIYSDRSARERLGHSPVFDLQSGLEICAQWLAYHGYIEESSKADDRFPKSMRYRHAVTSQASEPEPVAN